MKALIVSAWIDTNGQNARFKRAADRFGNDPDVISALVAGIGVDPAGVMGRFQLAAEKLGTLNIRSAHRAEAYFGYPADLAWTHSNRMLVRQLAKQADILHLNNSDKPYALLHVYKPVLLHHHGTALRGNPLGDGYAWNYDLLHRAEKMRWAHAVSTVDLMKPAPEILHWLPSAYDVDELEQIGRANRREPDGKIIVATAPWSLESGAKWKSTPPFVAAIEQLQSEGLPVEAMVITGKPWAECLVMKAGADIYFDQVILGYGCNAIEAWGMGLPVIAGADEWTLAQMHKEYNGPPPFYPATVETIADAIRALAKSSDLRKEWAAKGMAHIRRFHDEKPALARLAELYAEAIKLHSRSSLHVTRPANGQSWSQVAAQRRAARVAARRAERVA